MLRRASEDSSGNLSGCLKDAFLQGVLGMSIQEETPGRTKGMFELF